MLTIHGLKRRFESLDTEKVINATMDKSLDALTEKNKEQMFAGFDKTGNKISPKYRKNKYARIKNEMNPTPGFGTPDLKVTGDFYAGMATVRDGNVLNEFSTDYKNEWLDEKYDPFGLGGDYKKEFMEETLHPNLISEANKTIGLKINTK